MNAASPASAIGLPVKAHEAPPQEATEAIVWVIDKYIHVCEWESVVMCFNEFASTVASGDAITYIKCIRHAFVAIVNCHDNRCVWGIYAAHAGAQYHSNSRFPPVPRLFSVAASLAASLVRMCSAAVSSGVPQEQGSAL